MGARGRASEGCQHGAGDCCHAQWCMSASFTREADPTIVRGRRPQSTPSSHTSRGEARRHQQDWRHAHGDPDCPVRFGTHDGCVAHSAHLEKLHFVRFGTHDGRVAHSAHLRKLHSASRHLRLGGRDLTEYIMERIREGDCSGFHRETLLFGVDYDTALMTAVIHKEKTNELIDNIFTDGVKRFRFGSCQPSCCGTSGCVSLTAACTRWQCGVSSFMACGLGQAFL